MRIIGVYPTLAAGIPTAVGTYFEIDYSDIAAPQFDNIQVGQVRDGTTRLLIDPMPQFENNGTFTFLPSEIAVKSGTTYLGSYRYFGPVLYEHARSHIPIVIFQKSTHNSVKKCYVAYLNSLDPVLAGNMTLNTSELPHLTRLSQPSSMSVGLHITRDGIFTDITDINSAVWNSRS